MNPNLCEVNSFNTVLPGFSEAELMGQHAPARNLAIFVAEQSGSPRKSASPEFDSYDCSP